MASKFFKARKKVKEQKEVEAIDPAITEAEVETLLNAATETVEKEKPMEQEIVAIAKEEEKKEVPKSFQAFGIFYDTKKRKFVKVIIGYNPQTGYTSMQGMEDFADSSATAIYKITNVFSLKLMRAEDQL
jgi:rubrerythrin